MKHLLRKLRACYFLLRSRRYLLYTAIDEQANLHRWNYSPRILGGDISNLLAFGIETGTDDLEATQAMDDLLATTSGIRPAAQWPDKDEPHG